MIAKDREIEIFCETGQVYPNLSHVPPLTSPWDQYVAIIQLYDPTFIPPYDIENTFVKTVVPTELNLYDDDDNYIFAKLINTSNYKPYPILTDLNAMIVALGSPPVRSNYTSYDSFKIVQDAYDSQLNNILAYQWYNNTANHFTVVDDFEVSLSSVSSNYKVLLGKVVTRHGAVSKIDISATPQLSGLSSEIKRVAKEYIVGHRHGGNKSYDPTN
jgi:hypothetical protein